MWTSHIHVLPQYGKIELSCSFQFLTGREETRCIYGCYYDGDDHGRPRGQSRHDRRYRGGQSPEETQGRREHGQEETQRRQCSRSAENLVNQSSSEVLKAGASKKCPYFFTQIPIDSIGFLCQNILFNERHKLQKSTCLSGYIHLHR